MVRSLSVGKNGLRKGAWAEEEDNKLRAYIQKYGHWNWRLLPKYAGLQRCGKSCRLRWMNYLKPGLKRGKYSEEEDDLIIKLHNELGNKWSEISTKLPGRTDNEIKNHWHSDLKKRIKQYASNQPKILQDDQSSSETLFKTQDKLPHDGDNGEGRLQKLEDFKSCAIPILESSSLSSSVSSAITGNANDSAFSSDTSDSEPSFLADTYYDRESQLFLPSDGGLYNLALDLEQSYYEGSCSSFSNDNIYFPDSLAELQESFWTEPFLLDTFDSQNDYFCSLFPLVDDTDSMF